MISGPAEDGWEAEYVSWKVEAQKKGLDYLFEMDSEIPTHVIGDSDRLIQIINNVLSNAVKFTTSGIIVLKLNYKVLIA